jgi:hypothetical protein
MKFNSLSRVYFIFIVIILLSNSTTGVAGLKSDNLVDLDENQIQTNLFPDGTHLFEEDFTDYSIHNWDMTDGSSFTTDADPATASAGIDTTSYIETTDVSNFADVENMTIYFRMKTSSDSIYSRYGGIYLSDGVDTYTYRIGVASSGSYLQYGDDTATYSDTEYFDWNPDTWHWLRMNTYKDGTNRIIEFLSAVNADANVPDTWTGGILSTLTVTWRSIESLGLIILHNYQLTSTTTWEFDDIIVSKTYPGTVIPFEEPSQPKYDLTLSDGGLDIYKLTDVKGQTIELTLDAAETNLNIMIVDTNFGYSVLNGFLYDNDPIFNPHNLIDTYYQPNKEINYVNNEYDDLWVVVYSLELITGYSIDQAYNLLSSVTCALDNLDIDLSSNLPFSKTGVVTENGDDKWDDSEAIFIPFSLSAGDILDVYFELSSGDLFILMFNGETTQDIETALGDIIDGGSLPSGVYNFVFTVDGFRYFSIAPSSSISGNIAIFSYDSYNPSSMTFTLLSSMALDEVRDDGGKSDSTPDSPLPFSISYLLALPAMIIIYYRKETNI